MKKGYSFKDLGNSTVTSGSEKRTTEFKALLKEGHSNDMLSSLSRHILKVPNSQYLHPLKQKQIHLFLNHTLAPKIYTWIEMTFEYMFEWMGNRL